MIDRDTLLSTTNADERFFILTQQKTKKEVSLTWSVLDAAKQNGEDISYLGGLYQKHIEAERADEEAWAVLEEHLSLTQRRIILDCAEITPKELHATTASMKGMWDRDEIMGTVTDEQLEIIHKCELTSNYRDDCAGQLNDLIDNALNENATEIGKAYQKFQRAEDAENEAHDALCEHFTRFQRRMIYHCQPWL